MFMLYDIGQRPTKFEIAEGEQAYNVKDGITYTKDKWDNIIAISGGGTSAGVSFDFYGADAPKGSLACDGQVVLKVDYPALYSAIGDLWATTGGVATPAADSFRLPPQQIGNLGVFTRGRGATSGAVGTYKADVHKTHTHSGPSHTHSGPSHTHSIYHNHGAATTGTDAHTHTYYSYSTTRVQGTYNATPLATLLKDTLLRTSSSDTHSHTFDVPAYSGNSGAGGTGATGSVGTGATGSAGDATETRPRTITVLKCIWVG